MKFSKDQVQKIILSVILLIMLIVAYYSFLLKPLGIKSQAARLETDALATRVRDADRQINKTNQLRQEAAAASETLAYFVQNIPDGSPIAWFPLRMSSFFKRYNLENPAIRQLGTSPAGESLPHWSRLSWAIDIPNASFIDAGNAIAALENQELLMDVSKLNITVQDEDPEKQKLSLETNILLKQ